MVRGGLTVIVAVKLGITLIFAVLPAYYYIKHNYGDNTKFRVPVWLNCPSGF